MNATDHPNQPRNNDDATPIHIAAENNHIELVKLLMKSTGNPNQPRDDGVTPIFMAALKNHIEVVKLLINSTEIPNASRYDGMTPIDIAVLNNPPEIVQLLENHLLSSRESYFWQKVKRPLSRLKLFFKFA